MYLGALERGNAIGFDMVAVAGDAIKCTKECNFSLGSSRRVLQMFGDERWMEVLRLILKRGVIV